MVLCAARRLTRSLTVAASLTLAGCAAWGQGDSGLQGELAESRADAQNAQAQVEALEARLVQLERAQASVGSRSTQARVERLIEQNEVMIALAGASCDEHAKVSDPVPTASFDEAEAQDDSQRQQLAKRLSAYLAGRAGGLSVEQREAMRVLLRPDRVLDRSDPWQ